MKMLMICTRSTEVGDRQQQQQQQQQQQGI
jgi:hypothetical protein